MIDELHNMANNILGIDKYNSNSKITYYRLSVINKYNHRIVLKNSSNKTVASIKISRNGTYDYNLVADDYYLRCYDSNNKEVYYDEIYVSEDIYGMFGVIDLGVWLINE